MARSLKVPGSPSAPLHTTRRRSSSRLASRTESLLRPVRNPPPPRPRRPDRVTSSAVLQGPRDCATRSPSPPPRARYAATDGTGSPFNTMRPVGVMAGFLSGEGEGVPGFDRALRPAGGRAGRLDAGRLAGLGAGSSWARPDGGALEGADRRRSERHSEQDDDAEAERRHGGGVAHAPDVAEAGAVVAGEPEAPEGEHVGDGQPPAPDGEPGG